MPISNHSRFIAHCAGVLLFWLLGSPTASARETGQTERPNIVLILLDDLGFSDLGSYGSEIDTPNLDMLASNGLRFTQFYNTGRCCPTRASLLTGLHPHQTGIGHMTQTPQSPSSHDRDVPGYRGFINNQNVTLAQVLRDAGYHTMMTGKWHLGYHNREQWPLQRGFERYYGIISGASLYFAPTGPRGLTLGNESVEPETTTDRSYYTTDAFTDYAIRFVEDSLEADERPFFLYLAYNAPHWPLHAFEEEIQKYRGRYRDGWDAIREARYARMIESGLIDPEKVPLSPRNAVAWEELSDEKKDEMDLRMAIYAAMIDRLDQKVGDLVEMLRSRGELENTLILVLSDNGGCAEGGMLGSGPVFNREQSRETMFVTYGQAWANVSNTPFRLWKHFLHEGGMATPFIVHWPSGIDASVAGGFYRNPAYLPDIMPTLIEVSGAAYPERNASGPIPPMQGTSLVSAFSGDSLGRETPMFWEHEGNRAVRDGNWKLVSQGNQNNYGGEESWELYDMNRNRTELQDLRSKRPDIAETLRKRWWKWARSHHVVPNGLPGGSGKTIFELTGDSQLAAPQAPFLAATPFSIEAVFAGGAEEGVIVAQGGSAHGYALYIKDGYLVFATRHDGELHEIRSTEPLLTGPVRARAHLEADGRASLWIGEESVASDDFPGLLTRMPMDGLEVGEDLRGFVGAYSGTNPYPETIERVRIELK